MKNQFIEQQDNIICTFVRLYDFNVNFGLKRASEYLGLSHSSVKNRYYTKLRPNRLVFETVIGRSVFINQRRFTDRDFEKMRKEDKYVLKHKI